MGHISMYVYMYMCHKHSITLPELKQESSNSVVEIAEWLKNNEVW